MFKPKMGAIKVTGKQADELLELLNEVFGGEKDEEACGPGPVADVDKDMEQDLVVAKASKRIFDAHLQVGFTEEQALEILTAIIMA